MKVEYITSFIYRLVFDCYYKNGLLSSFPEKNLIIKIGEEPIAVYLLFHILHPPEIMPYSEYRFTKSLGREIAQ